MKFNYDMIAYNFNIYKYWKFGYYGIFFLKIKLLIKLKLSKIKTKGKEEIIELILNILIIITFYSNYISNYILRCNIWFYNLFKSYN